MHVAIVCVSLRGGGTERVVSALANGLADRCKVSIVNLVPTTPFYPLSETIAVYSPRLGQYSPRFVRVIRQFAHMISTLRRLQPDACLIFGEDIAASICCIAKLLRIPRVYVFNRGTPRRSLEGRNGILNPLLLPLANCVFVQTEQARRLLQARYSKTRLEVLSNPIDLPELVPPILLRPKVIAYVASLGRKKNQAALIRIFAQLRNAAEWQLQIVGDGPDKERLGTLVSELGISDKVRFIGQVKDVSTLLRDVQVFAFPSLEEGFPNALAEALAHGCSCISYDCPTGPAELIRHNETGFLVELGDEASFATHLDHLLVQPDLRKRLSEEGRKRLLAHDRTSFFKSITELLGVN